MKHYPLQSKREKEEEGEQLKLLKVLVLMTVVILFLVSWIFSYCLGVRDLDFNGYPIHGIRMSDWLENEESRFEPYPHPEIKKPIKKK